MFYCSKKSREKVIHTIDCFHVYNTSVDNAKVFETLNDALKQGWRLCKHCNPLTKHCNSMWEQILDFCIKKKLYCYLGSDAVSVLSDQSQWKITLGDCRSMILYHKNSFKKENDGLSEIKGYHLQKDVYKSNILDYLEYIVDHDRYRMLNPVIPPKKKPEPPRKGTKRYKQQLMRRKKHERRKAIKNVLDLIDSLGTQKAAV